MHSPEKRLLSNTVFLYIMKISGYIFPFLTFPYLTRVLGPDKFGVVAFSNAVMVYFQILVDYGFILSATNICSIYRDDKKKLAHITFGVIQAKMILIIIGAVVLFFCSFFVPVFQDKKTFLWFSYIGILLSIFLPDFLFRGIERMSVITYRILISKLVYTVLVFLLIRNDNDYIKVPVAIIGGNIIAVVLTWHEIIRKMHISSVRVSIKETVQYLRDSSMFFLSRIAVSMYQSLNTVVLGFNFSSGYIAQYGVANTLITSGRALLTPISDSIYPYMVVQKNYKLVKKIFYIFEPIIVLICIALFVFSKPLIVLLCGDQYIDSVPIFRAMLPLVVITLPIYLFGYPVLGALGKINVANISVIISSVFHIIGLLLLFFMGYLELVSVALLTIGTELILLTIRICYCKRIF